MTDLVEDDRAIGLPAPETSRRLVRALVNHREGPLDDDATILLADWHGRG